MTSSRISRVWSDRKRAVSGSSLDPEAGSIMDMFNFAAGQQNATLILDPTTGTETLAH